MKRLLVLVALLWSSSAWSQEGVSWWPQWLLNGTWHYSIDPICTYRQGEIEATTNMVIYEIVYVGTINGVEDTTHPAVCHFQQKERASGSVVANIFPGPDGHRHHDVPPPPDECSGDSAHGVGESFTSTVFPGSGDSYCNPISHCKMTVTAAATIDGSTVYKVKHTSEPCTSMTAPDEEDLDTGENCISGSGGEFCLQRQGENCGYFNDSFVCLPQIEDDGCKVFGDGGRLCGPDAPTPPAPDSGTAGNPATPDETVVTPDRNLSYFNPSTVAGSDRPAGDSGDNPFDGEDDGNGAGGGTCTGDDCGEGDDGSAGGGETCAAPPTCDGDAILCAVLAQEWRNRCVEPLSSPEMLAEFGARGGGDGTTDDWVPADSDEEVTIPESFNDVGVISDGACVSDYPLELGGLLPTVVIPFSEWCIWLQAIGAMVMVVAYLSGVRIVGSVL